MSLFKIDARKRPGRSVNTTSSSEPPLQSAVLDASALGVVFFDEPGADCVIPYMAAGVVSAVNLSELVAKAVSRGKDVAAVRNVLDRLPLRVVPFDADHAYAAAAIYPAVHRRGLSFADRACLALGVSLKLPVLTAERAWGDLSLPID